ncbi:HD domain-containing protein [Maridesulfovibrio ferrireducens]|uniref:HD domain-containing protein n=1 Tax=Maridesulfovibrio ferrireducens TaxID=246191 RepID=A0A1G9L487_9BACT|nr:HD domain-containing phosphohydrolase [Maridesulfovibrio ferrireducens]SDL56573.1 HD domain-containing protein [Maridesulfovibrio ferrireducens]
MANKILNVLNKIKKLFNRKKVALLFALLFIAAGTIYFVSIFLEKQENILINDLEKYQSVVLNSETESLSSQLVKFVVQGRNLAKARIFRLSLEGLASTKEEKVQKAQEDFDNFIKVSGFTAGHLFNLDGKLFATTEGRLEGSEISYQKSIQHVLKNRVPIFSRLRPSYGQLVSELFLPIFPAKALSDSVAPIKVLVLTVPMTEILRSFLATDQRLNYGSTIHIIQEDENKFQEVSFSYPDNLKLQSVGVSLKGVSGIQFGVRSDLYKAKQVYSSAISIPTIHWWVMVETDADQIYAQLNKNKELAETIAMIAFAAIAFLLLTISLLFSRKKYLNRSQELNSELIPTKMRKDMLEKICKTLPIPLCLKDNTTESYVFVNKAFADLTGTNFNNALGSTDQRTFLNSETKTLTHIGQMTNMSENIYTQEMTLDRGSEQTHLQVSGIPYKQKVENDSILRIFRDISEEKVINTQNVEMRQQIIDALVRAVESVPFLDGHTALMRLLSVEIAETLLLSNADCATVEASAILSQVGKSFIPKEIMQKTGKLTPEELLETQRYIEHTCKILEGIEFSLPITQTLWQMQENIDGSGYPNGLKGTEVSLLARILGVTNTFSALVQHRSYRKAKTAQEAVEVLQSMADKKFDGTVIHALNAVINSQRGKKILTENKIEF